MISRSSRPASSMSSWRKSSSMRPATRRARIGRRRSIFTTRASEPWKCQKSRHQWKNEKTVQPKLYRSLFPHDVFLSGASFRLSLFVDQSLSSLSTAIKASVGTCTVPRFRIFFLPVGKASLSNGASRANLNDAAQRRLAGARKRARISRYPA